jgi:RNA polymerase sigma-B factor
VPNGIDSQSSDRELLEQLAALDAGTPEHEAFRAAQIEKHLPLVQFLARKFADRGEPLDDLIQVGTIGLIKAIDRFDASLGFEFSTFATPNIVGEIKRHFRDKTWAVRVPRRLQELSASVSKAREELTNKLDRSPTTAEIAKHLGISMHDVVEALEANAAYSTVSLDVPHDDESSSLTDRLGSLDDALEGIDNRESLRPLLAALPERDKQILLMRFFENMTQGQIASEMGISQMHVSRILTKTLAALRENLSDD